MANILNRTHVKSIAQVLKIRLTAHAPNYCTTLAGRPQLRLLPIGAAANRRGSPPSPIPIRIMCTSTNQKETERERGKNSSELSDGYCNPFVDFFFRVVEPDGGDPKDAPNSPSSPWRYVRRLLPLLWSHNPLTTLKLIFNLGEEKYYVEAFYRAAYWLHHNHPKTLAYNIAPMVKSSRIYLLDAVEILYRLVNEDDRKLPLDTAKKTVKERYERDPDYRLLHDLVSDLIVERLKSDIENWSKRLLKRGNDSDRYYISWVADCCKPPSYRSYRCYRRHLEHVILHESIARKFFPRESWPEYQGVSEADYEDRVLNRLTDEVLQPLKEAFESQGDFFEPGRETSFVAREFFPRQIFSEYQGLSEADYEERVKNRLINEVLVPLKEAYKFQRDFYEPGGEASFVVDKYLEEVKAGKTKIAAGALLPHEIIRSVHDLNVGEVAELQWMTMVEDIKKRGKNGKKVLNNCLAVCDINSTLMKEIPLDVAIALGLLMAELSEEPWKGKVINYSDSPQLHLMQGDDLRSKCQFVRSMYPMTSCVPDIPKMFDLILEVAVDGNLKPVQMIRKVFVLSHQDFDLEVYPNGSWNTHYEAIQCKYKDKGYGDAMPHIVFWTLSDYQPRKPEIPCRQPGITILRGFSNDLLKLFLDNDGNIDPDHVMKAAISGKTYQHLAIVD